ncbi:DUF4198 domain-containing protein [Phenylobacterium montanum]|uniref:DUF4198 domain-containing protein n=1 Tax=Phenylobacterium montanum TaxID=2823693 RepID=A0A975IW83_9CAUL|nr:DUF4198 domain-containing protein [Caulobacter sp. S6]QUD89807.1 DUF4198 domain-containing protein [Caulobacter sp. S6]
MTSSNSGRDNSNRPTGQDGGSTHRPRWIWRGRAGQLRTLLALTAAIGAPTFAAAHDFWIQPAAFWLSQGGTTTMTILVGHGPYREKSLIPADRITRFESFGPDGRSDRRGELRLGAANIDTQLPFARRGEYVLALETNQTQSELPGIRFTDYIKAEGLTQAIELRARNKTTEAPGREVYSRRAKAIVQVGSAERQGQPVATQRLGLSLEIVPEADPYAPGAGEDLPVRIYYEGRPLAGALVKLNNLDFDARPMASRLTDQAGRAFFKVPRIGNWQFNVVWTKPIVGDPRADFETTFSSLTLGFPRTPPPRPNS